MGALFIAVVVAFPDGLAGLYRRYLDPTVDRLLGNARPKPRPVAAPDTPPGVVVE